MEPATVLIVEDEPDVAEVLEHHLARAGFRTLTAHDGLRACRLIGAQGPDVVLLDLMLPDLEGWEICRMVRGHADPWIASTPILILSALGEPEQRVRGLEVGADDYVPKPFAVAEVVLKVRNRARQRRAERERQRRLWALERERERAADLHSFLLHEVKNQLVVIGGFSRRLAEPARGDDPGQQARFARAIRRASDYLAALAEEVLLLRRVETGRFRPAPGRVDLERLAREVLELHRPGAGRKGVGLRAEASGVAARANAPALRACLSNLVENAVRYSPAGSTVVVRARRQGDEALLEVEDDGPGIPAHEVAKVFEKFHRGEGAGSTPGTGLGLYLVRTLTDAMGGRVELDTRPGRGTRVVLVLPPSP